MPFPSSPLRTNLGLLAMRTMVGVVFVFHGGQKLFGLFGGNGLEATAGWMESIGIPFPIRTLDVPADSPLAHLGSATD